MKERINTVKSEAETIREKEKSIIRMLNVKYNPEFKEWTAIITLSLHKQDAIDLLEIIDDIISKNYIFNKMINQKTECLEIILIREDNWQIYIKWEKIKKAE